MIASILIVAVAAIHVWIVILEMALWRKPAGRRVFRTTQEFADATASLAANQGLYNGFLVAGLVWGLSRGAAGFEFKAFFLACVIIAGLFGAATVSRRIVYVQAAPAALALLALLTGW